MRWFIALTFSSISVFGATTGWQVVSQSSSIDNVENTLTDGTPQAAFAAAP